MAFGNLIGKLVDGASDSVDAAQAKVRLKRLLSKTFSSPSSCSNLSIGQFFELLYTTDGLLWVHGHMFPKSLRELGQAKNAITFATVSSIFEIDLRNGFSFTQAYNWGKGWIEGHDLNQALRRAAAMKASDLDENQVLIMQKVQGPGKEKLTPIIPPIKMALMSLDATSIENACGKKCESIFQDWKGQRMDPLLRIIEGEREHLTKLISGNLPISSHIRTLSDQLDDAKIDDLLGENQGGMVQLYRAMYEAFERHGLIAINQLASVPQDVHRINQIETIIDLYNLKIHRTENDETLPEAVRERKVQALQHLMEKDIDALGGVV